MARDPTYPLIPTLNILGFILVLIPFSTKALQKWHTGICMFAIYVSIMSLFIAIDTIVWSDNYNTIVPVWCDIVSHFSVASLVGVPACSLVISRRLCKITKRRSLVTDKNSKRKELISELCIAVGFPIVSTGLYYIIQGARFQLVEQLGCARALVRSWLTIILSTIWPIILPAISILFYSPRILWFFYRYKKEMNEFLGSSQNINQGDYFRVMMLGCLDAAIVLPVGIYNMAIIMIQDLPWPFYQGWTWVHSDWEATGVPESYWSQGSATILETRYDEIINPILAIVFFLIFGLTKEARANYRSAFYLVIRPWGITARPKEGADLISTIDFVTRDNPESTSSDPTTSFSDVEKGINSHNLGVESPSESGPTFIRHQASQEPDY